MASIHLQGILKDSLGEIDVGAIITFTHMTTTGETIASTKRNLLIPPNGAYSIDVEYGQIRIDYTTRYTERFVSMVIVNQDSTATSLPELLNAAVPVTPPVILEMNSILTDAVSAATTSEAFANQLTTFDLIGSTAIFAPDTNITTKGYLTSGDGGSGSWVQNGMTGQTVSQTPAQLGDALLNDGNGNQWSLVINYKINVLTLGAIGDGISVDTLAFIAARNGLLNLVRPFQGGTIYVPPGVFLVSGFDFINFITIEGAGILATVLKTPPGANENVINVSKYIAGSGLNNLTIDGNAANNPTSGHGLFFQGTVNNAGDSFLPYRSKTGYLDTDEQSTKHFYAHHFYVGACREDGIHKEQGSGFQVFLDNFVVSHNLGHGFHVGGTDCVYTNYWAAKNNKAGVYVINGANKLVVGKVIWNNRGKGGWAGFHAVNPGGSITGLTVDCECQDNYGDGAYIKANDSFIKISSNQNGYLSVGNEDQTDGVSSNLVFDSCANTTVDCESFTYND